MSGIRNSGNYKHKKIKKAKIAGETYKNYKGNDVAPSQTGASCRWVFCTLEYDYTRSQIYAYLLMFYHQ